ncbi:MAG: PIN domain-containing protein [Proteobacteria bacterium]|nr:PIN domain-containing protein [Pseudomonadota bacterium]
MILVDTSLWIDILKDSRGSLVTSFRERVRKEIIVFCRFTQLELLQGAKNEHEWRQLDEYLTSQYYLEANEKTWPTAARIFFELRRKGITVRSPIDCCIATIAHESKALLLHKDKDFTRIDSIFPFEQEFFNPNPPDHP